MTTVDDQIIAHMTAFDEQRAGIEQLAGIIATYYQALISGGVGEQLASLLTLQYQLVLMGQVAQQGRQK